MLSIRGAFFALAAFICSGGATKAPEVDFFDAIRSVSVVGTEFRIVLEDGRLLSQDELVGRVLLLGGSAGHDYPLRIDGVERDALDPAREIILYRLSTAGDSPGEWRNVCDPDLKGQQLGFPMSGTWTPDGRHIPSDHAFSITCTAGAESKCVRMGYKPWRTAKNGTSLWDLHQACTRLIRADYCGDGQTHTRDGTLVDIYDRVGVQPDDRSSPDMKFEAAWGVDGAACVRRTRIAEISSLQSLANCARLTPDRLGPTCDDSATALLFNRSIEKSPAAP